MAPKKAQKMSLNEFLGDSTLGSWADEMDALPTAPSGRADDDRTRGGDRRRDDFLSSRPDRMSGPPREDLPLPTEPPFTAFVGNLAFDLTESELEEFFGGQTKSVKIIRDRDDKPKGFGYIEFNDLDGLKEALVKSGSSFAGRTVRVSVAEPPKERSGFGGGFDDDAKFAGNWRREGPLPDLPSSRDGPRKRFDGAPLDSEPSFKRRGSGLRESAPLGLADTEDNWHMGSKFKASGPAAGEGDRTGGRFGSVRARGEMGPPKESTGQGDEGDWRRPHPSSRNSTSPNSSTPPTPQLARRKLELLPRSNVTSAAPSPLASPNPAATSTVHHRANPFGAAKPVDVSAKESAVADRIEKERETTREKVSHERPPHNMSRTSSKAGSQREYSHPGHPRGHPHPASPSSTAQSPTSPTQDPPKLPIANVRPSFSFASAAAGKKDGPADATAEDDVQEVTEKIQEVEIE
ncbi:putative RNA-binding protein sce3 [Grifola frondosa]|uniref:Putative RNA-binding protein sce3 n=1 Tax=Grifola frondosa TaxID=5627 RepID=A0A1C7M7X7_GRIFR|nr:putative RNA-binding protein sce3 [Grifola frondosa]